ncbi:R3H domain-containing protein 4 [Iris pallida]|uniref:R3H domain-containing protein 4 n=1 Tax=Iris pallida TaxID=29817 RepID=A0AAX6IJX5_IRIPA|nr:R3H domain-containing protein 4 [Iris pallida]KAJ6853087.1 R3H domain-containing protein 4 [Iris pallida]
MATADLLARDEDILSSSIFDPQKGGNARARGQLIERKIDVLENLAGKVSNRRSRRWLNDRILIELVPRLNVEEIRGLFAPPPFGDGTPLSAFCMTNFGEWDAFRNVDMDAEARMIGSLDNLSIKRKDRVDNDKAAALKAWHRVDCRSREALRRYFLSGLIESYEECLRSFVTDNGEGDVLVLHVQDPFNRLLLHGVCEYYNLISVTVSTTRGAKLLKMTRIKKKLGSGEIPPNIRLASFLKMAKEGAL